MRRVYILIGIWFALAGLTTAAFGDPIQVTVQTPNDIVMGQPYVVNLIVTRYGQRVVDAHPVVVVHSGNETLTFRASEHGHDGIYSARVLVPLPGNFTYDVQVNGKVARRATLAAKLVAP
jgi:hypothetical protein